eukprot:873495-Pleurochrysis_carterae.AAC.1
MPSSAPTATRPRPPRSPPRRPFPTPSLLQLDASSTGLARCYSRPRSGLPSATHPCGSASQSPS